MNVYGIPNCNSVKKALDWLKKGGFKPVLHDFKKEGTDQAKLEEWCSLFGWEAVLNKKGTTWRKLDDAEKASVVDQESAVRLMMKYSSAIKRPVVEVDGVPVLIGFDEAKYALKFKL